jgi:predicted RND superfamily exporter protein
MKELGISLTKASVKHAKTTIWAIALPTLLVVLLAAVPSFFPRTIPWLHTVTVDTDPENMLSEDEAVRVFHDEMKAKFDLNDMVVVGVVNDINPNGVFNPESLANIFTLTEYAKTLVWEDKPSDAENAKKHGVIPPDILAPSTVDNIEPGELGAVKFEWLMPQPPKTQAEADAIRESTRRIPFFNGTLVSEDGKAICLYLPITAKDVSSEIYNKLQDKIAELPGDDRYHITGLPVAEDVFGVEMFVQMAISAPGAMLAIFLLMLLFFRKLSMILSPLIVAMISVLWTMSLLIVTGNTIHIMSSMIPIFIMPIAVLDSIHILSMFFDQYQRHDNRRDAVIQVMHSLFMPMLYTSLTSAAGFASLALTPIPPVQVFGLFCAAGIMIAWLLTITFIPAYIALIPEHRLQGFGASGEKEPHQTPMGRMLAGVGRLTYRGAVPIVTVAALLCIGAYFGINRIRVNDNPIKWFKKSHPIRVADHVLNDHFGGTYMAYLALEAEPVEEIDVAKFAESLQPDFQAFVETLPAEDFPNAKEKSAELTARILKFADPVDSADTLLRKLIVYTEKRRETAASDADYFTYDEFATWFAQRRQTLTEVFKDPAMLEYIAELQNATATITDSDGQAIVGKSNSLTDIVKTVHRALLGGADSEFRIPDTPAAVAQCLIQYQSSHRPQDLDHFVTPDFRAATLWLQLRSGDNIMMKRVEEGVSEWIAANPPPAAVEAHWFGLTYINVIWQEKMVAGMRSAFLGSFLVVFIMMTILFRSALWGILCMIPLTVTIAAIYGAIGFIGKDYDMPVAVLSSLALGLAVDFAIHFLEHSRVQRDKDGDWRTAAPHVFGDPARAIARNVVVIAVGFLPLLLAPLLPYVTVGVFLAAILGISGVTTLFLLPALIRTLEGRLFPETKAASVLCNCASCAITGIAIIALVAINVYQFMHAGWTQFTWISIAAIPILALACCYFSRHKRCGQ